MTAAVSPIGDILTAAEGERRTQLEADVDRGLDTFVDVGHALTELGERSLYRSTHGTFADYVKERFGLGVRQAYRLIESAKVAEAVRPMGHIQNERQARELVGLAPDVAQEIVTSTIVATGGKPTAKTLREARDQLVDKATGEIRLPSATPTPRKPVTEQTVEESRAISNRVSSRTLAECVWHLATFEIHTEDYALHAANWDATQDIFPAPLTPERMRLAATYLTRLADAWEAQS